MSAVGVASTQAGYIALLGRPNVGKSTLLNCLLEQKLSITSPKPQTTRHTILGIKTLPETQLIYVDTPGLHSHGKRAINRYMNRAASQTLAYVDVAVMIIEALRWTEEDQRVLQRFETFTGPSVAVINKVDQIKDKAQLLPYVEALSERGQFDHIVPLSALKNDNVEQLEQVLCTLLPQGPFLFSEDQLTTVSQRFVAAELIREKLTCLLHEELPYALTVEIETFKQHDHVLHIGAIIWVERPGQKGIVIGAQGQTLKRVGQQARADMEQMFEQKVFLQTWVKVRSGWSDDEQSLQQFGYQTQN